MPNKYKLKEGVGGHRMPGGRRLVAGSVIETEMDLAKMFPNKFKILKGPKPTRQQVLLEEQNLDEAVRRRPRAAVVGTDLDSKESQEDDGDDSDRLDPMQGEDSDVSGLAGDEEGDEEEAPPKKKLKSSKTDKLSKKKRSE